MSTAGIQRGAPGTFVYLLKDDSTVTVRPVKLGVTDGDRVEVLSGLAARRSHRDRRRRQAARRRQGDRARRGRRRRRPAAAAAASAGTRRPAANGGGRRQAEARRPEARRAEAGRSRSNEPVAAIHPAAGGDLAADGRRSCWSGMRGLPLPAARRRCPRSITRPSRSRPSIPAPART